MSGEKKRWRSSEEEDSRVNVWVSDVRVSTGEEDFGKR